MDGLQSPDAKRTKRIRDDEPEPNRRFQDSAVDVVDNNRLRRQISEHLCIVPEELPSELPFPQLEAEHVMGLNFSDDGLSKLISALEAEVPASSSHNNDNPFVWDTHLTAATGPFLSQHEEKKPSTSTLMPSINSLSNASEFSSSCKEDIGIAVCKSSVLEEPFYLTDIITSNSGNLLDALYHQNIEAVADFNYLCDALSNDHHPDHVSLLSTCERVEDTEAYNQHVSTYSAHDWNEDTSYPWWFVDDIWGLRTGNAAGESRNNRSLCT